MGGLDRRGWCGLLVAFLIIAISCTPQFRRTISIPTNIKLPAGESHSLHLRVPLSLSVRLRKGRGIKINNRLLTSKPASVSLSTPLTLESSEPGEAEMEFLLFGIPLKRVLVKAMLPDYVIPGGHSIGVLLTSQGIIVVGYDTLVLAEGKSYSPGRQAGIEPGDLLLEANGKPLLTIQDLAAQIQKAGEEQRPLELMVKRDQDVQIIAVRPQEIGENRYRIGLYVRDGANGVGTLSFVSPETQIYGALGHVITDLDTGKPLTIRHGSIAKALISNVTAGTRGRPGEKIGVFQPNENTWGSIAANTEYGIFGRLESLEPVTNPYFPEPIPVAFAGEVYPGTAEIYTVVQGDQIEKFEVEIERVMNQHTPSDKGLVLHITDPQLLDKTGGIIQGMSGSPIIQNGKLAGIVTHVFVNDPTRGFGVLAEWMVQKSKEVSRQGTVSVPSFLLSDVSAS